jgi:hypothetical protein
MQRCIRFDNSCCLAVLHGLSKDIVAVIVVEDHQIVVASAGRSDEPSSLISIDLSRRFCNGAETFERFGGNCWGG